MTCFSARSRRNQGAFTLLEVLVALLIAAAGFGGVLTALAGAQRAQRNADEASVELSVARQVLEEAWLGVLPAESYLGRREDGADEWRGVRDGLSWTVTSVLTATGAMNAEPREYLAARGGRALGQRPGESIALPMEIVRCRVGRVELSTVRW